MAKLEVQISCPKCGEEFDHRLEEIRPGAQTKCPGCKAVISFEGDDGRELQRLFDDFPKNIEIKL